MECLALIDRECDHCKLGGDGLQSPVIVSFRHKGLKLLYEKGDRRRVSADYADKVERILARLDEATEPGNMDLLGFRLHPLKGDLAGFWSVSVSGNCASYFGSTVPTPVTSIWSTTIRRM